MERLSEKEWATETIGDAFSVSGTTTTHPSKLAENGSTPRITCASVNNGLDNCYGNEPTEQGGVLTVDSATVGTVLFQPSDFIATDHVEKISGDKAFSEAEGLFIKTCIDVSAAGKYQYGYKFSQNRIKRQKLMLPVDDKGNPDYAYMTLYSTEVGGGMLMRYKNFIAGQLSQLEHKAIPALGEKKWGEFFIGDLFTVSRPKARNKDDYDFGNIPFVASGAVNNGVMKCCNAKPDESLDKGNCITVSPVDGSTFYQPMDFLGRGGAGSSILMLRSDWLNLYLGQFVARAVQQTCSKYTYGHMGNKDSIKRERIMLPISDDGKPDYEYMEQYAKNMMLRKYEQYLAFIDRQSSAEEVSS